MPRRAKKDPLSHEAFADEIAALVPDLHGIEILCGIPSFNNAASIGNVVRAVEAGLRKFYPDRKAAIVVSDGGSKDGTVKAAMAASTAGDQSLLLIDPRAPLPERRALSYSGIPGKGSAFRAIFEIAGQCGAQACAVFDSDLRSISPHWVEALVGPVASGGYDFVAPLYARHKYDGTITNSIAYPVTAALYGRRLRQPIGGEFGFSGRLAAHWARKEVWTSDVARFGVDIWMTTVALVEGFSVCQSQLGAKIHDPKDPGSDLAPMFRQVVGSLFALAGRYADTWRGVGQIAEVPTFGFRSVVTAEEIKVRIGRLTWRFIEGYMRYERVWREIMSAETFAGVSHATDEAAERTEGFVLRSDLWARLVYDYLVAYNEQNMDVSLLLDSMIPLYFARTATFVQESSQDDQEQAERRIEEIADLFAAEKGRLGARWDEIGVKRTLVEQKVTSEGQEKVEATDEMLGRESV